MHGDTREVSFAWDWRVVDPHFEVFLGVTVGPSKSCGERLVYQVVGTFDRLDQAPTVPLERFVAQNAIATLLPFVREGLVSLSSRGPFGPYYLPPINAIKLAAGFNYAASTGQKQLEMFPEFRRKMITVPENNAQDSIVGA